MQRTLRVLQLSRYDRSGPSSRLRQYQYADALAAAGIDVVAAPLFDTAFVARLFDGRRGRPGSIVHGYLRRLAELVRSGRFDLLWIEYELFPWLPYVLERLFRANRTPYVLELDDAVFHRYDLHPNPLVRRILGRKIDSLMRGAAVVVAGNAYIAGRARSAGARRVEIVPTAVDIDLYRPSSSRVEGPFTVGWIGSPVTASYLEPLVSVARELRRRGEMRFVVVGGGHATPADLGAIVEPWTEESEVRRLQSFHVGVMPLRDGPWERGKCGLKIIQYHACGIPAVASPVGVNEEIVDDGVSGFLPRDAGEWVSALDRLRTDEVLRLRMGEAGRRSAAARFSTVSVAPRLIDCLRRASARPGRHDASESGGVSAASDRPANWVSGRGGTPLRESVSAQSGRDEENHT